MAMSRFSWGQDQSSVIRFVTRRKAVCLHNGKTQRVQLNMSILAILSPARTFNNGAPFRRRAA